MRSLHAHGNALASCLGFGFLRVVLVLVFIIALVLACALVQARVTTGSFEHQRLGDVKADVALNPGPATKSSNEPGSPG